jgi:hypothetical protein
MKGKTMNNLLDIILEARGGRAAWEAANQIQARQFVDGALWGLKGHPGALNDVTVTVDLNRQFVSQAPFFDADHKTSYTPDRVAVETSDGQVVEELLNPRASFDGHELMTPWSRLQLAYFSGFAMWTYLAEPINLTLPGVSTVEIDPWEEDGETFRRLKVTYPGDVATQSSEQVLYVSQDGLIRRRDYNVDIAGGSPAAHYASAHQTVSGLVIPTHREVYGRDENNNKVAEPLIVSIDLNDVVVS